MATNRPADKRLKTPESMTTANRFRSFMMAKEVMIRNPKRIMSI